MKTPDFTVLETYLNHAKDAAVKNDYIECIDFIYDALKYIELLKVKKG